MKRTRSRLVVGLILIALVVGAGIGGWTYLKGKANGIAKDDGTGQPSTLTNAEKESKQAAQCAGPLPKQSRVQVTKLAEGKLGEWVSVKNEQGNAALRFKVDLLETKELTKDDPIPIIASLFSLSVENLSCEDLKWPVERGGLWLSWREPHPKDVSYAWVSSAIGEGDSLISINVQRNGKLNAKNEGIETWLKIVLDKKFGKKELKELPDPVKPNQTGEAEVLIILQDPYRKTGPLAPIGLYKDGRLHLAMGGELSWALVDLGRAEDWMKK